MQTLRRAFFTGASYAAAFGYLAKEKATNLFRALAFAALIALAIAPAIHAQSTSETAALPANYATAGLFYNTYTQPHITGFGAYAKQITGGTYSYTVIDVTSRSLKDFRPETTTTSGIAQYLRQFAGWNVFGVATAGVGVAAAASPQPTTGADVGFSGSAGFLLVRPIRNDWSLNIPVRVIASTLGPPQYVIGLGFGWGK